MKLNLLYLGASSALVASTVNAASIAKSELELQENQCSFVDSKFFITPARVSGDTAASYCRSLGGRLADVNQQNAIDLNSIVSKCLGPDKSVRIQTWDTNSFGTNHLALSNGFESAAGSVNVAAETEQLYALCEMVDLEGEVELDTATGMEAEVAAVDNVNVAAVDNVNVAAVEAENQADAKLEAEADVVQTDAKLETEAAVVETEAAVENEAAVVKAEAAVVEAEADAKLETEAGVIETEESAAVKLNERVQIPGAELSLEQEHSVAGNLDVSVPNN